MKKIFNKLAISLLCLMGMMSANAADAPVKSEMRSAWVATVWQLDWPSSVVSSTGNESQIQSQKNDMTRLLDSLQVNNLNAINFQIRSRCDAMYKSSYEPWSTDLVRTRGLDPGYDPLAFVVEECHKRGMECHAWINPYRYESVAGQWSGGAGDYRAQHPDWIMDVNGASILNPGKPEVTQRICDIIAEVVTNYDIDGVLFDDYFYLSGTTDAMDGDLYAAYKEDGGTLSQADWRRDNVNRMVAAVNKTIKSIKPYVRFGVAPAGIACTSSTVAKQYGISPCPTGSDWQYSSIYSDPIAWYYQQSVDFISPQIYWTIGYSTDYDKATKWWSEIGAKFNRHMYVSHDIASLTSSSKAPGMTDIEAHLMEPKASGPNNTTFEEYANEVRLNRQYTQNDAPGSIFYSCKYLYKNAPLFVHYLKTTVFNTKAIMPSLTWQPVNNPGVVTNCVRGGNTVTWQGKEDMRYTVYAVPVSVDQNTFNREAEYLLGVSYETSYTIPDKYLSGYNIAVCIYDRFGNEYSPVFAGANLSTLPAPKLISPIGGETIEQPFNFEWMAVNDATNYIIEISDTKDMENLLYVKSVEGTGCASTYFYNMPIEKPLYWRVRACGSNYNDGVSAPEQFTSINLTIVYPANGETDVPLRAAIKWSYPNRQVTVQIANNEEFSKNSILFEADAYGSEFEVPQYVLKYYTNYFARLLYVKNAEPCITEPVSFTTEEGVPVTPVLICPVDNGTLYSNDIIAFQPNEGISGLRVEVSETTSFPARTSYLQPNIDLMSFQDNKPASEIKVNGAGMVDGKTYYARYNGTYRTSEGVTTFDWSPTLSFVYSSSLNSVDNIVVDGEDNDAPVEYYGIDGRKVNNPSAGIYIRKQGKNTTKVIIK